jgi:phytoene dehydrogenase-like protein
MKKAYVVGAGPNGLTAAIVLARAGVSTTLLEAQPTVGGGARSAALTLPGFIHDVCSAVHPMALSSPIFATFPLAEHGLEWIQPPTPLAHPFDDGSAATLERSLEDTARRLGRDAAAYRRWVGPWAARWKALTPDLLAPLHFPSHPFWLARFGAMALWPAAAAAHTFFKEPKTRALFAGAAAHAFLPMEKLASSAAGWVFTATAHAVGWPIPRGGTQKISDALASYFKSLGGEIVLNTTVRSLSEIRDADAILCDVTPRQLLRMAGDRFPGAYRRKLEKYRYGPGVFKMDWALNGPIPWKAAECARAGTIHIGATLEEIAASERDAWAGRVSDKPFTLVAQPSLFDPTRAPQGRHTAWAYCHVPHGSTENLTETLERQIERFAPGFRSLILARHAMDTAQMEAHNANLIGGDITGGAQDLSQLFFRPTRHTYRTPAKGIYICSSSTPPGGGVHGQCGAHAARAVLKDLTV